jgi:hypothetical protein
LGKTKDVTVRTVPIRFESCTIIFESTEVDVWEKFPKDPTTETTRYTVPLSELSGVEILKVDIPVEMSEGCSSNSKIADCAVTKSLTVWAVFLHTKSDVILDETHDDLRNTTKNTSKHSAGIGFYDESLAKRVSDAFKHAADLCRGTEPF